MNAAKRIFEQAHRGKLLDIVVFIVNVILMTILSRLLAVLARQSLNEDVAGQAAIFVCCLLLAFLEPIGAILKRTGFHRRNPGRSALRYVIPLYFLSQLLFLVCASLVLANLVEQISGDKDASLPLFAPLFFAVPLTAAANTAIIYSTFTRQNTSPFFLFLDTPQAESLGDIVLFLNMIGYLALWGYLMNELPKDYKGIRERLFTFAFTAALIYLPPRLFLSSRARLTPADVGHDWAIKSAGDSEDTFCLRWYTSTEIVKYMVARVDCAARRPRDSGWSCRQQLRGRCLPICANTT